MSPTRGAYASTGCPANERGKLIASKTYSEWRGEKTNGNLGPPACSTHQDTNIADHGTSTDSKDSIRRGKRAWSSFQYRAIWSWRQATDGWHGVCSSCNSNVAN